MALAARPLYAGIARGRVARGAAAARMPAPDAVVVIAAAAWEATAVGGPTPAAYVLDRPPSSSARPLPVPSVAGLGAELFRDGEFVEVDGTRGSVRIEGVEEIGVVTAFLATEDGRILLLRRSDRVGSFRGRWAGVSGYLEDPTPLDQALREVREEVGYDRNELELLGEGDLVLARDRDRIYVVHPFLFRVRREDVRLDWEHTESAWVAPQEIGRRDTVPELDRAWAAVASGLRRKG